MICIQDSRNRDGESFSITCPSCSYDLLAPSPTSRPPPPLLLHPSHTPIPNRHPLPSSNAPQPLPTSRYHAGATRHRARRPGGIWPSLGAAADRKVIDLDANEPRETDRVLFRDSIFGLDSTRLTCLPRRQYLHLRERRIFEAARGGTCLQSLSNAGTPKGKAYDYADPKGLISLENVHRFLTRCTQTYMIRKGGNYASHND